jgi:hypothetical protein
MSGQRDKDMAWLDAVARDPDITRTDVLVAIGMLRDGCLGGVIAQCEDCGQTHELAREVLDARVDGLTAMGYINQAVRMPCECGDCSGEYILELTIPAN